MAFLEERVDSLEDAHRAFVATVGIEFNKLYNAQMRTELELQAFKDEMKDFKDEMKDFKDEMKEFKREMQDFKEEGRRQNREMNRRWGELANKMGTLVEDLVAPSIPRIVREVLNQEVLDITVRWRRKLADGRVREFDALAFTADTVCLTSTKSTLRNTDVERFGEEVEAFRTFFPEQAAMPIVGILASLAVEPSLLTYAERQGFVVLAVGDQLMEVQNSAGFVPKKW